MLIRPEANEILYGGPPEGTMGKAGRKVARIQPFSSGHDVGFGVHGQAVELLE